MANDEPVLLTIAEVQQILQNRTVFYRMLSSLYYEPLSDEQIEAMASSNLMEYGEGEGLMCAGIKDMARYLRRRNSGTHRELAVDFTMSFGGMGNLDEKNALPLRCLFMPESDRSLFAEGYREAFATYKQSCVKKVEGLDYPEDHLMFMFQFMALLSARASEQLAKGNAEDALVDLKTARQFLKVQIISWFPAFSERAEIFMTTKFYKGILKMTYGYLMDDEDVLDAVIQAAEGPEEA